MEDDKTVLRPTGKMERFNIIRNDLHMYNSVHVSARYTIPSSLLVSSSLEGFKVIIYSALALVLKEHPILNVTTKDEHTNEPKWQHVPSIDFDQMVRIIDQDPEASPDAWLQKGFEWHVDRVDGINLPVWRIIIAINEENLSSPSNFTKFTIAFYAHHSIADGGSAASFHTRFLSSLNTLITDPSQIPSQTHSIIPIPTPKLPLLPSIEAAIPLPVSFLFALLLIFKTYIYNPPDTLSWTGPLVPSKAPQTVPICQLTSFSIPPEQVTPLIQKCRAENTTLTSLLCVLVARKLALLYPTHSHFIGTVPFSMLKLTTLPPNSMGCFVSNIEPYFSSEVKTPRGYISCSSPAADKGIASLAKDEKLWSSTRQMKSFLHKRASTSRDQNINMLSFVSDIRDLFTKKLGNRRDHAFEVTNITTIDGGLEAEAEAEAEGGREEGKGKVEGKATFDQAWFCGGMSTYASPWVISVVSVKGGWMSVCVTWEEGVVSAEEAGEMKGWLERGLRELGVHRGGVCVQRELMYNVQSRREI